MERKNRLFNHKFDAATRQYGLRRIIFSTKEIRKFQKGRTKIIIDNILDDNWPKDQIPHKDEFLYVGESFRRRYGVINGMRVLHSVQYDSDKEIRIINSNARTIDEIYTELLPAEVMLEAEARYFLQVRSCKNRYLRSLKLTDVIHKDTYNIVKTNRVLLLDFSSVSREFIDKYYAEKERLSFWDDV